MRHPVLCVAAALLLLAGAARAATVATADGPVEGVTKSGVTQFLGIPYAAPPVGPLRWMPPAPSARWSAPRAATQFGPPCAQVTTLGPFAGPANSNEDCLTLNVVTPDVKARLPVLVWIHGGGYYDGASKDYDASRLAARGRMVVVTFNYRLNLFGFLAHPALGPSGNYGLMDMQAVLRWVHANIASFGGEAGNVTIGGQSAGAGAAAANVISPGARGLIHRAIFQSGGYTPFSSKEAAEQRGQKFAAAAGCSGEGVAQCLHALPAEKIAALAGTADTISPLVGMPEVDGSLIPLQTSDALESGAFNKVPVMMGTTRDEGNFFNGIAQYFKPGRAALNEADFRDYVSKTYGGNAGPGGGPPAYPADTVNRIVAEYPVAKLGAQMAWDRAHSDMLACRGQYLAGKLSAQVPTYMYLFDDATAPSYFPAMPGYRSLAYHTADIGYVFRGFHGGSDGLPVRLSTAQKKLSDKMIDAWAAFARSGNPNGVGDAPWPRWSKDGAYFLQDDAWAHTQANTDFSAEHHCSLWQSVLLYR